VISGASSLCFLLFGVIGIIAGRLGDIIGPRMVITGWRALPGETEAFRRFKSFGLSHFFNPPAWRLLCNRASGIPLVS